MNRQIKFVIAILAIVTVSSTRAKADEAFDDVKATPKKSAPAQSAESRAKVTPVKGKISDSDWRLALGLNYMPSSTDGQFSETVASNGVDSIKGSATVSLDPGAAVVIEARKMKPNSWGALAGLNYELERKVKKVRFNFNGTIIEDNPSDRMQFTTIYGSGVYQWDNFYMPMGLNYSLGNYKMDGAEKNPSVKGSVGAQVGAGYFVSPNFAIEANAWITSCAIKSEFPGLTIENNNGRFANVVATGKYVF